MEDDPKDNPKMIQMEDENPKGKTMFKPRDATPSVALLSPACHKLL